jgi:hypothetical protein
MENHDIEQTSPHRAVSGQPEPAGREETEQSHLEQTVQTPVPPPPAENPSPSPEADQPASPEAADLTAENLTSEELTQPAPTFEAPEPEEPEAQAPHPASAPPLPASPAGKKRGRRWPVWMLLGLLVLVLIAVASGYAGYLRGIHMRQAAQDTLISSQLQEQFDLAVQDMSAGRYELAYQRLSYINQHDSNYPGMIDLLVEVRMNISTTPTPTLAPTPTLTPTPDLRAVETLVSEAQQAVANNEWTKAIDTLLSLRKSDPQYQAVMVDDLLYISYRNRGRDKILREADLEGGIYDLTLAQRLGPLDAEAEGLLNWAGLYITGASFWEIDWAQAVYYFGQVAPALPNLQDGSHMTASERYKQALIGYGDDLMKKEQYCDAVGQFELAASQGADVGGKYDEAIQGCAGDNPEEGEEGSDEENVVIGTPQSEP